MSDATTDPGAQADALDIGPGAASSMAAILDFLAPEENSAPASDGGSEDGAPAGDGGSAAPAGEGAGAAGEPAGAPAAGAGGEPPVPASEPAGGGTGDAGASGSEGGAGQAAQGEAGAGAGESGDANSGGSGVDAASLTDEWARVSTGFEEAQTTYLKDAALTEVRQQYPKYYEAIEKHPRLLVGQKVPRADGSEGEEVLRDSQDAKEWQEVVKQQLAAAVESKVNASKEELSGVFDTVHSSIELFKNNTDLVPGTKQFDRELADEFATFAKPYELRSDGKLMGYSVPVQPMINQIRSTIAARRAKSAPPAPAAPAATAPAQQHHSAGQARTPQGQFDGPQAGIQSKAGQSGGGDDIGGQVLDAFLRQNGVSI